MDQNFRGRVSATNTSPVFLLLRRQATDLIPKIVLGNVSIEATVELSKSASKRPEGRKKGLTSSSAEVESLRGAGSRLPSKAPRGEN